MSLVALPPIGEWPVELPRWLYSRPLEAFFAPLHGMSPEQQMHQLLLSAIRGRQWGSQIIPRAATPAECYPVAVREAARWSGAGSPLPFLPTSRRPDPSRGS